MVMDVSLGRLQQLVAVADNGSFSKAAIALNISQPALSRSIASVEDRYGFQIFSRVGHGVHLTAAGGQVLEQARPLLQSLHVFDNNLRLFGSGKAGELSLGFSPLLASQLGSNFATAFYAGDMSVRLRILVRPGSILLEDLKNDVIEMFFCTDSQLENTSTIDTESLGEISPICVVRGAHPLARRRGLTRNDLTGYAWASAVDPPIDTDEPGLRPPAFICDNHHLLREAVLESDLIWLCSPAFVEREIAAGLLTPIWVTDLPLRPTTILMAKLKGRVNSPLAEGALDRMRSQLSNTSVQG